MFEKVSRSLKYDSNYYFLSTNIERNMDTNTVQFTPLALRVRGKQKHHTNLSLPACTDICITEDKFQKIFMQTDQTLLLLLQVLHGQILLCVKNMGTRIRCVK